MMKVFFDALIITFLVSITGLAGYTSQPSSYQNSLTQLKNIKAEDTLIPVVLPETATAHLKQGSSMSGRLIAIAPDRKQIKLERGIESEWVAIADIERVTFQGKVILRRNITKLVFQGETNQSSNNNQTTWTEPLTNFKLQDPNEGKAEIQLTSVSKLELLGILSVSEKSDYVVKEMSFQSSDKITVKVIPDREL